MMSKRLSRDGLKKRPSARSTLHCSGRFVVKLFEHEPRVEVDPRGGYVYFIDGEHRPASLVEQGLESLARHERQVRQVPAEQLGCRSGLEQVVHITVRMPIDLGAEACEGKQEAALLK